VDGPDKPGHDVQKEEVLNRPDKGAGMADVVISYGRDQEPMAGTVARALEADGYSVWWDHDIPAHKAYATLIEEKFQAAKAVIVIWSSSAVKSEWVRAEADLARSQQKLIQVSVQGTIPPLPFSQIQFAALQAWDGTPDHPEWRRVRASLRTLCGEGAEPGPQPQPIPPPKPQPQPAPKRQPVILIAVAAALAAAVVGLLLTRQQAPQPEPAPIVNPGPAPQPAPSPTPAPAPAPPPASADFLLPQSGSQALSPADIASLDKAQLRLARNEIYARHGRIFKSPDLAAHFSRYAWYRPLAAEVSLSPVEQQNVDLLQRAEADR